DVVSALPVCTGSVSPQNNRRHKFLREEAERGSKLAQGHGGSGRAGRGSDHNRDGSDRRIVRRLKIDLSRADIRKVCEFPVKRYRGAGQGSGEVVIPGCGLVSEVVAIE